MSFEGVSNLQITESKSTNSFPLLILLKNLFQFHLKTALLYLNKNATQEAFTCSKSTIKTTAKEAKYVQS